MNGEKSEVRMLVKRCNTLQKDVKVLRGTFKEAKFNP